MGFSYLGNGYFSTFMSTTAPTFTPKWQLSPLRLRICEIFVNKLEFSVWVLRRCNLAHLGCSQSIGVLAAIKISPLSVFWYSHSPASRTISLVSHHFQGVRTSLQAPPHSSVHACIQHAPIIDRRRGACVMLVRGRVYAHAMQQQSRYPHLDLTSACWALCPVLTSATAF